MLDPPALRRAKRIWAAGLLGATLLIAGGLSLFGLGDDTPLTLGPLSLFYLLFAAGGLAGLYLAAALGLGATMLRLLTPSSSQAAWLTLALGPALALWISHAMGVFGLLSGAKGQILAFASVGLGCMLLLGVLARVMNQSPNLPKPPLSAALWPPAAGLLLIAAANPPGWLWQSEGRNYDSLSYHLQLPQEWARAGRLWPLEHNIYSYLPGYVEAAYLHLAALMGAGRQATGAASGLLAFDGLGAIACQFLHASMGLLAAVLIARVTTILLTRAGLQAKLGAEAGALAGAAALATPWVIVVSSLSYNESAVNLFFAGALLAALDDGLRPAARGALVGLLVGAATACKPTAAFLVAPTAGLALLAGVPVRAWAGPVIAGTITGLSAIAPFLVRNALASGNPVFPAATAWFGTAHWTLEQAQRFAAGHRELAGLWDRVALLLGTAAAPGSLGNEPRGLFHSQWSLLFPAGLSALAVALTWKPLRLFAGLLLVGLLLSLAWWVTLSHCQSRFLLPIVVPLGVGLGLAAGRLAALAGPERRPGLARLGLIALAAAPIILAATSTVIFLREGDAGPAGRFPNIFLVDGTSARSGENIRRFVASADPATRERTLSARGPEAVINLTISPLSTVYLLGDATPFYFTGRVLYHTTWDTSPLGAAIRKNPDNPDEWTRALRARGVELVLVNTREIDRLASSGWYDPAVTLDAVARWLSAWGEPVRQWPASGHALFRLRTPPQAPPL
jgi:hypothetical protein